ncbi:MAG TPA: hypothetical protein VJV75_07740 [Candidatus Polarisedimenticolia bacterium]|nr:hypothetical protein [Candidatus Polarisedimenticolia bacterium]
MNRAGGWMVGAMGAALLLAAPQSAQAAGPALMHYQGVLRGSSGAPLNGAFDMTFRYFETESGPGELLVETHLAANAQAVTVDKGLFAVTLGSGTMLDGASPGLYLALADVFMNESNVWLEVQIGSETLAPRTRVGSSAYAYSAQDSDWLDGHSSGYFLDTSSAYQTKVGPLRLESSDPGPAPLEVIRNVATPGAAGYFADNAFTGRAHIAEGDTGIRASGDAYGGYFESPYYGSNAFLARDSTGVWGNASPRPGSCAGRFLGVHDGSGHYAFVGCNASAGVDAYGNPAGHFLANWGYSGEAYLGQLNDGVHGYGLNAGGYFYDLNSGANALVGASTYKILGNGAVSFIQNHPTDRDKVVVYAAPEGDEVAVYTRGSARLDGGVARVRLGETFALVANPDIGLSAHVTPIGEPIALAVAEKSTSEIVVRGPAGSKAEFDYIVWGLRIGFESQSIVQPKRSEAMVPSMREHEAAYDHDPTLRAYNALERFETMRGRGKNGAAAPLDRSRSKALLEAIGVFEPPLNTPAAELARAERVTTPVAMAPRPEIPPSGAGPTATPDRVNGAPAVRDVVTPAPTPTAPDAPAASQRPWLVSLRVTATIDEGDLVVLDPEDPGAVRPCRGAADRTLVGVAASRDRNGVVEVAVAAIVEVRVDAAYGAIAPGDLLTTSETPGAAMRAASPAAGTILGKALESLEAGVGRIRVLLMPR